MNVFKRIYCRTFQAVFRIALPLLPYREPKIFNSISDVAALTDELGVKSVMMVTDAGLRGAGITAPLESLLEEHGVKCVVYDKTRANPTVANVEEALELYKQEKCECLIAFGGGSSMDCAKALGARVAYPKKPLSKLKGTLKVIRRIPTLIAIPTTAGTGSEVTLAAVVTDSERNHKYPMNDFSLIPRYAVHDPAVTFTLPPSLTATTGMDALTHAVEAYIGRSTTKETRRKALEATKLIFENIQKAYENGKDYDARANMLKASYLAGISFSKSYVGYIHAVAHSLGGQYNVPHGLANSVLMPYVLEAYGKKAYKKLRRMGIAAGVATKEDSREDGAKKFIEAIKELNTKMNIPNKIKGIKEEDIPHMAAYASKEANPLYPVPVLMNAKKLEQFYYAVADWSEEQ